MLIEFQSCMCFIIERLECDFDQCVKGIKQQADNKDVLINMSSNETNTR